MYLRVSWYWINSFYIFAWTVFSLFVKIKTFMKMLLCDHRLYIKHCDWKNRSFFFCPSWIWSSVRFTQTSYQLWFAFSNYWCLPKPQLDVPSLPLDMMKTRDSRTEEKISSWLKEKCESVVHYLSSAGTTVKRLPLHQHIPYVWGASLRQPCKVWTTTNELYTHLHKYNPAREGAHKMLRQHRCARPINCRDQSPRWIIRQLARVHQVHT